MKQIHLFQKISSMLIIVFLLSCEKESITIYECTNGTLTTFERDIFPILDMSCRTGHCHAQFDEYSYVKKYADNKKLLGAIQHKKGYSSMPPEGAKLNDSIITKISCWVQNGVLKN